MGLCLGKSLPSLLGNTLQGSHSIPLGLQQFLLLVHLSEVYYKPYLGHYNVSS